MAQTKILYPWIREEILQSTTKWNRLPAENLMHARACLFDFSKAMALQHIEPLDDFQKLKTYLAKGKFLEAHDTINKLKSQTNTDNEIAQETLGEILLDESRLAALEARWQDCIEISSTAIEFSLPSITNQALHQVRSIAYYELGRFTECLKDIQVVEELMSFFTESSLGRYATATKIKIYALIGEHKKAASEKKRLWSTLAKNSGAPSNNDWLLSLLRLEIDLCRIQNKSIYDIAHICHQLAIRIGDDLFAELAFLDMHNYKIPTDYTLQFSRTKRMHAEVLSKSEEICTTAKIIRSYGEQNVIQIEEACASLKYLYIHDYAYLINLETLKISVVETEQYQKALHLLATPCDQDRFFCSVWDMKNFTPDLHINNLRVFLHRLKKQFDLPIVSRSKQVQIANYWSLTV